MLGFTEQKVEKKKVYLVVVLTASLSIGSMFFWSLSYIINREKEVRKQLHSVFTQRRANKKLRGMARVPLTNGLT